LTRLVVDELELRLLATTDSLTGAMSPRAFFEEADRDVALARRRGSALSCLVVDVDYFKRVNDTRGHSVGDHVLQRIVAQCHSVLRASDYLGRIGGEEFAIMLPDTTLSAALEVSERLRGEIEKLFVESPSGELRITISCGLACLTDHVRDARELVRNGDVALYVAKSSGRNRSICYQSDMNMRKLERRA
jgi:diguanylate cyclase (GGDEF)-like protein